MNGLGSAQDSLKYPGGKIYRQSKSLITIPWQQTDRQELIAILSFVWLHTNSLVHTLLGQPLFSIALDK